MKDHFPEGVNVSLQLDIGGEGRNERAWNLNPSPCRTVGPNRGRPIPRRIPGRAEAIPLPDHSVDLVIVERTPLRKAALYEIARVIARSGSIILRHSIPPNFDPHALAKAILPGRVSEKRIRRGNLTLLETTFECSNPERTEVRRDIHL